VSDDARPDQPPHFRRTSCDESANPYVSRGGLKLRAALDAFELDVSGWRCVDLGCSTGGFTDCLLQAGAASVVCVDTGYGVLDWKLRNDACVTVHERANALHLEPDEPHTLDLAVIDLGWTRQALALPAALKWIRPGGHIVTLIKPHYEAKAFGLGGLLKGGVLDEADAQRVCAEVVRTIQGDGGCGVVVEDVVRSPILGGKGRGRRVGNVEFLAHVRGRE
jgi:23S rRNA (cytidine1920-2'-O)/16S rRNA (cytidine1409-2'-O)-methyltransferase